MLHLEFAVASTEINSVSDLALLDARFGFDRGAVLSVFPKAWFREVSQQLVRGHSGASLARATERLKAFKDNKSVSFSRIYQGNDWKTSVIASHATYPFHRIVEQSFNQRPMFISSIAELDDADFNYNSRYLRNAQSLSEAASALLVGAEKVTIYDPFICVTKPGYRKTLLELMRLCNKPEIEFHIFSEEDGKPNWTNREQELQLFKNSLPNNIKLYWYCADDNGSGFLHPRGLLTAKGGLVYDRGFVEPNDRDQRTELTDIIPMASDMLEAKAKSYNASQHEDFELVRDVWCSQP